MSNIHLVTGYAGQEHVTSADQGVFNASVFGNGQFVLNRGNKFAASAITNNNIRVLDGDILMQGRHIRLNEGTYVDLTIESGTSGYLRNDLIVVRYTKNSNTGTEECNLVVIKGENAVSNPSDPEYTVGDIISGNALQNDMPLYRVPLNGLTVGTLRPLFNVVDDIRSSILDHVNHYGNPHGVHYSQIGAAKKNHANQHAADGSDPVTPSAIGAVAKDGSDPMTGNLVIQKSSHATVELKSTSDKSVQKMQNSGHRAQMMIVNNADSMTDYRGIFVTDATRQEEVSGALMFVDMVGGKENIYPIAHKANLDALNIGQVIIGSYEGNGKYGENNPNKLVFDKPPKWLSICDANGAMMATTKMNYTGMTVALDSEEYIAGGWAQVFNNNNISSSYAKCSPDRKTIYWYVSEYYFTDDTGPSAQANASGRTYRYIAIC